MDTVDLVIIGGGVAGLTAAQYGARANLNTLLIEEIAAGGQALLIDNLENYPGVLSPREDGVILTGYDLADTMRRQAETFGASFMDVSVLELRKEGNIFILRTSDSEVRAYSCILATGAKHRHADVPGELEFAGKGVSYCATCDGPFFKGKPMLVIGGGDAACDESSFLSKLSDKIIVTHRRDRFRAQKAVAERVLNNSRIEVRFNTLVKEIRGTKSVESVQLEDSVSGRTYEEKVSAVFVFVGTIPQSALAGDAKKDEAGHIITDAKMATSIPGLFAAGDVRSSSFHQVITASSDGAIAAHSAAGYLDEMKGQVYG